MFLGHCDIFLIQFWLVSVAFFHWIFFEIGYNIFSLFTLLL